MAVEHLRDAPYDPNAEEARAITMEIIATLKELLHMHPIYNEQLRRRGRTPERLAAILVLLLLHLLSLEKFLHDPVHDVRQHCTLRGDHQHKVLLRVLINP